jgi:hypothetical protein
LKLTEATPLEREVQARLDRVQAQCGDEFRITGDELIAISGDSGWVSIRSSHSPGGDMKKNLMSLVLASGVLLASAHAATKQEYQSATVVSVESHETPSDYSGSNPSDAPLQSEVYSYDIGIRLGCTVYRTRYESAFDYLPSVFTPNHPIDVNPHKHVMYVSLPGDRAVRMAIGGRRGVKDTSCVARK